MGEIVVPDLGMGTGEPIENLTFPNILETDTIPHPDLSLDPDMNCVPSSLIATQDTIPTVVSKIPMDDFPVRNDMIELNHAIY